MKQRRESVEPEICTAIVASRVSSVFLPGFSEHLFSSGTHSLNARFFYH